jgi:hypothetical protein
MSFLFFSILIILGKMFPSIIYQINNISKDAKDTNSCENPTKSAKILRNPYIPWPKL